MNREGSEIQPFEIKESPDFKISIVVHRHGPKAGEAGPLSEEGKVATKEYFDFISGEENNRVDIEHSPVIRTQETAEIYSNALTEKQGADKVQSIKSDERLSEGTIAKHLDLIDGYGGRGGKWIKGWMDAEERPLPDVKTGKEAVSGFAEWLLSKVYDRQAQGGEQEIQAFSHAPVMIAFMFALEEKIGEKISPEDLGLFMNSYLSVMSFSTDSSKPDIVDFYFGSKHVEIPISTLEELASVKSEN